MTRALPIRHAIVWAVGAQYSVFALQFGTSLYLARTFIGPSELGLFSVAFATAALVALVQDFGFTRYLVGEAELSEAKVKTVGTASMVLSICVCLALLAMSLPLSHLFDMPALMPVLIIFGLGYLFTPFALLPAALLQRHMNFRSMAYVDVGSVAAGSAIAILLAHQNLGAMALAWGSFSQLGLRALIAQIQAGGVSPWPWTLSARQSVLTFGSGAFAINLSGQTAERAPEILIAHALTEADVGLYSRATGLAGQLRQLVSGAVTAVFLPAFARARERGEALGPYYERVVAGYCAITWPAMAGLAVIAEPLVTTLYGPDWSEAGQLAAWIALSHMCFVALPLHIELPMLMGRFRALLVRNLADSLVAIGLLVLAVEHGVIVAAMSRLAYGLIWLLIYGPFLRAVISFRWTSLLSVYCKSAAATLAAIAPAGLAVWNSTQAPSLLGLVLPIALGVLAWLGTLLLTAHPAGVEIQRFTSSWLERARVTKS